MRKFAAVVSGGFLLIFAAAPLLLSRAPHRWPWILAAVLLPLALVAPRALVPVHRLWMKAGHALGYVNSRIILTVFFYALLSPIALLRRLLGKGEILRALKPDPKATTYRVPSPALAPDQMERPF